MKPLDQTTTPALSASLPTKREYQTPQVIELGDIRELTRGGGGSIFDGPGKPTKKGS